MTDALQRLRARAPLAEALGAAGVRALRRRNLTLVLGNDREIGRRLRSQERRVGITPPQVTGLQGLLAEIGVRLSVLVVENAGARAGYADADYVHAGAEIVTFAELSHESPPDVVHALKEPSAYESTIPGPFCRIGALHSGDFDRHAGFARLLAARPAAIFDGSNIGASDDYRKPIRGSMSVFAGRVAAEWVLEHLASAPGTSSVVVVGGGKVGTAAVMKLLREPRVETVTLFDRAEDPARLRAIAAELGGEARVQVAGLGGTDDLVLLGKLSGAAGLILAPALAGGRAPKVITARALQENMPEGGIVVDVSIDERGAIADEAVDADWASERLIEHFTHRLPGLRYQAVPNMPRAYPKEASFEHGEAISPYLALLLFLCAREGGPLAAVQSLLQRPFTKSNPDPMQLTDPVARCDALLQDLRNGLAVHCDGIAPVLHPIIPPGDRDLMQRFLQQEGPQGSDPLR
jgi:alanine dehydrogenase